MKMLAARCICVYFCVDTRETDFIKSEMSLSLIMYNTQPCRQLNLPYKVLKRYTTRSKN